MRVRLADEAVAKLRALHAYVAVDAPTAADALIDRLTRRARTVGDFQFAGRAVPEYREEAVREVLERPFRIIHRVAPDEVVILTVMHYRQLLPDELPRRS